ncbi:MAG TPA: outer membrane beta-barrel protein [Gemmatimonadaceae bacterium]|nr:outer membrane beta-barrel protein [Gemmatimonadaceae bacterium]
MLRRRFVPPVALLCAVAGATSASAQRLDRISVQAGGMYQRFTGQEKSQTDPGTGFEAQVRYHSRGLSVGGGVDYVQHTRTYASLEGTPPGIVVRKADAKFTGVFVEPRFSLGDARRALQPYFLLRAGYGRATPDVVTATGTTEGKVTSLTWNGGLGMLLRIAGPLSGDLGVSGGVVKWKSDDKAGAARSFASSTVTNGNWTARAGFSLALAR